MYAYIFILLVRLILFYVYDSVNAGVTHDAISEISGSGNPTIVHVSQTDSTRSRDTPVQLYIQRRQTVLVYITLDV